ncbi:hypothetical protein [Streptomyces sp. TRM64462]|uniref:hypothetical protein n=1 Tax=Streptomyces sp. TRM64462 TaxID=2741726 RepID=UPI0020C810ED|nr:hypothetical protein [Streptomyces sp. TRM64462]
MTDARCPIRALRAALFAAVCVVLSATGHALQSAHQVPPGSLLLAFGATAALAWAASGRRRGPLSIGAGLVAVQGVLHLTFAGGQAHHHAGHGTGGSAVEVAASAASAASAVPTAGMLATHLLAGAVCALWLARGEAALFRLARTAFVPLRPPLTAVRLPAAPRPPRARPVTADRPRHGVVLAHTLSRRGPPVLAAPRATALGATSV